MRLEFSARYTQEEIKTVVFDLNQTKALGPYGFHAIFFQNAWKDCKGKVLAAWSLLLLGSFAQEIGYFIALRQGLQLAKSLGLFISLAENSSPSVASIFNSPNPFIGDVNFIVLDIKALFVDVNISKCQAIPSLGNSLTLNLALLAFSSTMESLWLG
ncbi:hypothetical protein Ddye_008486 [Dipteronia dyeriana]|uniref:RNase H type-1 domain-containing protein n=1 Tax=Dipteronia dyeriana TaxID=168575 RepID=A0AAE0CLE8_9ROSI|nr:hypothetical protein Ddye_008486 [Dipteronia dyeriana]